MRQAAETLRFRTPGRGLVEITREVAAWTARQGMTTGLLTLFCRHTSASLIIQENAAPAVRDDLEAFFSEIAPEDPGRYLHDDEGPDDMPAHAKSAVTRASENVPVSRGRLALGTWQAIYLIEHRLRPHTRRIVVTVVGR
jgi:secondary thiamine-phosphate synthase enzyme